MMKSAIRLIRWWMFVALFAAIFAGCSDDDTEAPQQRYGFVQFRLYKSGSYTASDAVNRASGSETRAADRLEWLHDATKIKVTLRSESSDILSPTLTVTAADNELAEWGMQSDKFQLMTGSYTILGYELYDNLDRSILAGEPDETTVITVVPGGLVLQDIAVSVTERGWVKFRLTKDLSQVAGTRAVEPGNGADTYPMHAITYADVKVQNQVTNETTEINGLKMTHEIFVSEKQEGYYESACTSDSTVLLKAGLYKVVGFTTYFDRDRRVGEVCTKVAGNGFLVKDNLTTEADVPVTLVKAAGHIADGITLKKIWEALDGPNWKTAKQWDFNRDVDLWTAQPGVQILPNGRVALLNFEDTGAQGAMPAVISELTELRQLYLGTHSYYPTADSQIETEKLIALSQTDRAAFRRSFHEMYIDNGDPLGCFPEEMKIAFKLNNISFKEKTGELRAMPGGNDPTNYACRITSLPKEINDLKKLETLYIAFSPMTDLPEDLSGMESLTDVEIFHCPEMTTFPKGLTTAPALIALTFADNSNVRDQAMHEGLVALAGSPAAKTLQSLLIPTQELFEMPDLRSMEGLGQLNMQSCGLKSIAAPFGKEHIFVQLYLGFNELESLPVDEEGYFIGLSDQLEMLDLSNNKLTEFPDIFNAKSVYILGTIDFSSNRIERFGTFNGTYRGINAKILNLSSNKLSKFPAELYPSGSSIGYLQIAGNGMEEVEKEALEGDNTYMTSTIDLSYNKLKKLPATFNSLTFPYLNGLELSYNRFDAFPYSAVNNQYLNVLIFRHQRDENGNRCMKEWPAGIGDNLARLRALFLGSNDIRRVNENRLSYLIYNLEIADNPNILIDVSSICPYIKAGMYNLIYSPDQDIRGCDALDLNK